MLLSVDIQEKSFGDKVLYRNLSLSVEKGEKVGLIGRNGTGKSTLFGCITGSDTDYAGEVHVNRSAVVVASRQEHHGFEDQTALEYILADLPEYAQLSHIIHTYPETMGTNTRKMQEYSDALDRFGQLEYYEIEDDLQQAFEAYQLPDHVMNAKLGDLSGGQKRMVELIKVQRSRGDLALIDEPTNHMDYIAKASFIKWLRATQEAVLVITHDRDVLREVDRIIEIRDLRAVAFKGNYDDYLRTNKNQIVSQVNEYEVTQRRIENLKNDVIRFRRLKERSRDPGTIHRFKSLEQRAVAELADLQGKEKPTFWIDRESVESMNDKLGASYDKHKAKNIRINTRSKESKSSRALVDVSKLSLGYGENILFSDVSFILREGERVRLHGRNGAGKTTLVQAIMAKVLDKPVACDIFAGRIANEKELKIGLYEQEIDGTFLELTLHDAIEQVYLEKNVQISDQKIKQQLGDYLFNPATDGDMPVARLSGGQKARFQLISMLANDPQILILDEPTNHLDLPSIEELENALADFHGAIIYISHDSYFAERLGGTTVSIGS